MDGWRDTAASVVYGRGLVTKDYNVYGHTWSVNARIYNPEKTRSQSWLVGWSRATTSSTTSMPILDDFGHFFIEVVLKEKCPYLLGLIKKREVGAGAPTASSSTYVVLFATETLTPERQLSGSSARSVGKEGKS